MKTTHFYRNREPITLDITDRVSALRPRWSPTLVIPFTVPMDYLNEYEPMPNFNSIEVGYERFSMTTSLQRLRDSKEWGDNRVEYLDDTLVTVTFMAPHTMRIRR